MSKMEKRLVVVMAWISFPSVIFWFILALGLPYVALVQPLIWIRILLLLPFIFIVILTCIDPDIWEKISDYQIDKF